MLLHEIVLSMKLKDLVHSFLQGWTPPPSFLRETPLSGYSSLSEAAFKNYPLFLRAIKIGAWELY